MSLKGTRPSEELASDPGYQDAVDFLFKRINFERSPELASGVGAFRLERMKSLLSRLGDPHKSVPCVHIAGTKGKGSTATMVARILECAEKRVGLFTSPHANRFEERFTVNGELATESAVVELVDVLRRVTAEMDRETLGGPTFFELATAAGWLHFQKQNVDIAVIEVGLGGRLDSTNVCHPLVSVISSISKDHTRLLGDTVDLIAREKAGIIKPGVPVVCGVLEPGPQGVIHEVADAVGAPLYQLQRDFTVIPKAPRSGSSELLPAWSFDYCFEGQEFSDLQLKLPGEHQTRNAALAVTVGLLLDRMEQDVKATDIRTGLSRAKIPLRIDVLSEDPVVIVDAAHNPASIAALCETLRDLPQSHKVCVFASSRDKDCVELLRILDGTFSHFLLTAYQENPRAIPIEELGSLAESVLSHSFELLPNPESAMQRAIESACDGSLICATGSFFLAAEVEAWWRRR